MKTTQIKLSLPYCNSIQGINNNNKKESLQVRINFWAVGIWNKRKFYPKAQPQSHPIKNLGIDFLPIPNPIFRKHQLQHTNRGCNLTKKNNKSTLTELKYCKIKLNTNLELFSPAETRLSLTSEIG